MRDNKILFFTSLIFILALGLGLVFFFFWRLGIFKKESELSQEANLAKGKTQFINSYNFKEFGEVIKNLSVEKIEIPSISITEIGREKLF